MARGTTAPRQVWGMIEYEIVGDGCLNGTWNNNFSVRNLVMNEIARKIGTPRNTIEGTYHAAWLEGQEPAVVARLTIIAAGTSYSLEWIVEGEVAFNGVGRQIGPTKLIVMYWDQNTITFPQAT
jgi:hypothetical protein